MESASVFSGTLGEAVVFDLLMAPAKGFRASFFSTTVYSFDVYSDFCFKVRNCCTDLGGRVGDFWALTLGELRPLPAFKGGAPPPAPKPCLGDLGGNFGDFIAAPCLGRPGDLSV